MSIEYKLSQTGREIDAKLGKIDGLVEAKERLTTEISVERARINTFTALNEGSTTGDAELADARVDKDGNTHANVGEHIRSVTGQLSEQIDDKIIDSKHCSFFVNNILNIDTLKIGFTINPTANSEAPMENRAISDYICVNGLTEITPNFEAYIVYYNKNREFLSSIATGKKWDKYLPIIIPQNENVYYVRLVVCLDGRALEEYTLSNGSVQYKDSGLTLKPFNGRVVEADNCSFFYHNMLDVSALRIGYTMNTPINQIAPMADRAISAYIRVNGLTEITPNFDAYVSYYDENYNHLPSISPLYKWTANAPIIIPQNENVYYVRIIVCLDGREMGEYTLSNSAVPYKEQKIDKKYIEDCATWYKGKKITVYGDSITQGNQWQPFVSNFFDCNMVNCGVGGTTVFNNGGTIHMSGDSRINTIPSDSDVIILFGGANDWSQGCPLGELGDGNLIDTTFKSAYSLMIKKIVTNFPNANVISMTTINGRCSEAANADSQHKINGLTLTDFSKAIQEVSQYYGIPCIDVHGECGINTFNRDTYIADIVHPNNNGGKRIANAVINGLKRFEPIEFD